MENEYVLITGASSGIGAKVAELLSKKFNIILNGRDEIRLKESLNKCMKGNHLIWQYDLKNVNDLESNLSSFIKEHNIKVSYFVHCAGMMKVIPIKMVSTDFFSETINTNVIAAALVIKLLSGKKLNDKSLRNVVFISSNISNFGAKAHSVYGASKAALDGLMRSLAMELAPNVRINSVLPGGIKTALTATIFENEELVKKMEDSYPLGLGNTNDIANVVEFLLSDQSRWMTGQQITVDGGRTINLTI